MELATKGYAQLADLFKSMTPAARVTAALLLLVTVVSVAYLFNHPVAGRDAYLLGGELFAPSQLRDMQAAFGKAGLEAEIEEGKVKIPRGQESKYMAALADADALPAEFGHHTQEAVSGGGFLRIGHSQQEAARRVAKQQDLQEIISDMDGIDRAAVLIDEEQTDGFPRGKKRVTAAVMVRPETDAALDERTLAKIKQMMVGSVAGLEPDAVTVVDSRNSPSDRDAGAGPASDAAPSLSPPGEAKSLRDELRAGALAWLNQHGGTLALCGLALVGLLVLRSTVRSLGGPKQGPRSAALELPPALSLVGEGFDEPAGEEIREPSQRRARAASKLSSELADAVRHDPEAAVSVLRAWIGNAS